MVATQSFSISRRTLDVEDYIDMGRRHAGWIIGPAFLGVVVSICVAFLLTNEYMSKATMQITPAQVSELVVQSTISNTLNERIRQMETSIMSVRELSAIINDPRLLLYNKELKTKPLEDIIEEIQERHPHQFRGPARRDEQTGYRVRHLIYLLRQVQGPADGPGFDEQI